MAEPLQVGCTVALANGARGVVVPLGRDLDPATNTNVMHLDGSIQTVNRTMIGTVLYNPHNTTGGHRG